MTSLLEAEGTESKNAVRLFLFVVVVRVELSRLRSTALITSLFFTSKMADACLVCLYKQETSSRGITFRLCTVLLLTEIVLECMFLRGG